MERKHLLGALEYTEKLLSLGEKTIFDTQANSIACFLESDFAGKEGVSVNTENGDVWLRMKRLRETNPPKRETRHSPVVRECNRPQRCTTASAGRRARPCVLLRPT